MTTMNTPDDLIRLLRNDPDFRGTVRREVLTEELLGVPSRLSRMERSIEALLESNATLQKSSAALQEKTTALRESTAAINRRLDMVEKEIKLVGQNVNSLDQTIREHGQAQSSFRGNHAQDAAIKPESTEGVALQQRDGR